jgi:hypothetical protein
MESLSIFGVANARKLEKVIAECKDKTSKSRKTPFIYEGLEIHPQSVKSLIISNAKLQSIETFVFRIRSLVELNLSFNKLVSLGPLVVCRGLELLDISHNKIESLEPLSELYSLRILRCQHNMISKLEWLARLCNLEEVWLLNNQIEWNELIYMQCLSKLEILFIQDNPCDKDKSGNKYTRNNNINFIIAQCSNLILLDGNIITNKNKLNVNDFLKSPTGRSMLTQARGMMGAMQRQLLIDTTLNVSSNITDQETGNQRSGITRYRQHETGNKGAQGPKERLRLAKEMAAQIKSDPILLGGNEINQQIVAGSSSSDVGLDGGNVENTEDMTPPPPSYNTKIGVVDNKALINVDNIQTIDNINDSIASQIPPLIIDQKNDKDKLITTKTTSKTNQKDPITIRFNEKTTSPVAVSLYVPSEDDREHYGDGYIQWNRKGLLGCSVEAGHLLANHKNGQFAATYSVNGEGTVMDSHGQSRLNIKASTARVMSSSGETLATLTKGQTTTDETFEYIFDNLTIRFDPKEWTLIVTVDNNIACVEFDVRYGGRFISRRINNNKPTKPKESIITSTQAAMSLNHNNLRTDLASVMTGLDTILSELLPLENTTTINQMKILPPKKKKDSNNKHPPLKRNYNIRK